MRYARSDTSGITSPSAPQQVLERVVRDTTATTHTQHNRPRSYASVFMLARTRPAKTHIEELHLRIGQDLALHSAPRFLEAVVVGLVEVREFKERFLVTTVLF